jgi:hypothetical protein
MDPELKLLLSGIVIAFYGLFMAAVVGKYREVRQASLWIPAPARIVSSQSEARKITKRSGTGRSAIRDTEIRNFAAIRYVFTVNGRRIEGQRIGIGEDMGNFRVAEKLLHYPAGKDVTVFYDRNHPENCVLERDLSDRAFKIAILCGALFGVCGMLAIFASSGVLAWVRNLGGGAGLPSGVSFLAIIGSLVAVFAYAFHQRGRATFRWPRVIGTIASSSVDQVETEAFPAYRGRTTRLFRIRTIYSYRVAGVTYRSDRISLGGQSYASIRFVMKGRAARLAAGQEVAVFYNPDAPEQAVLTQGAPGQFILWLVAAALLAGAAHFAGMV